MLIFQKGPLTSLRTEVRGDFNIDGTKYLQHAVFHQKSKIYDVVITRLTCKPLVPLIGQTTHSLPEILTWLDISESGVFSIFNPDFCS